CCTSLFVIRCRRSATTHKLPTNMSTHSRVGQRVNHLAHSTRKVDESFCQFLRCHIRSPSEICNFYFSFFNFQFFPSAIQVRTLLLRRLLRPRFIAAATTPNPIERSIALHLIRDEA